MIRSTFIACLVFFSVALTAFAQSPPKMPDIVGKSVEDARTAINMRFVDGVSVRWLDNAFANLPAGFNSKGMSVLWQFPKADTNLRSGPWILVVVGMPKTADRIVPKKMPRMMSLSTVLSDLNGLQPRFRLGPDYRIIDFLELLEVPVADGSVLRISGTYPHAGDMVEPGSYVGVVVDTFNVVQQRDLSLNGLTRMQIIMALFILLVIGGVVYIFARKKSNMTTAAKKVAAGDGA